MKIHPSLLSRVFSLLASLLFLTQSALPAGVDLNSNGISDVWELLHEDAVDPDGDADGDGQTNLQEAIFGTNPLAASDSFRTPTLRFASAEQIEVSWPSVAGKRYQLQTRADLAAGDWDDSGEAIMGNGETLAVTRPTESLAKMYVRVKVSDVDTDGDSLTNWEELTLGLNPDDRGNGTGAPSGAPRPPSDPNVVTVRANNASASEDGGAPGQVSFRRTGDTNPLMVGYSVSGTATRGVDHTLFNAWFSLPANVHSKNIDVNVLADSVLESSESVTVTITWVLSLQPTGSISVLPGLPNRATVIINNSTEPSGTGLLGQYFDTASATYTSSANFDPAQLRVTRVDQTVNFDWMQGTPNGNTQLASTDNYSVRWTGFLAPGTAGAYVFQLDADDRARVLVDTDGAGPNPAVQILENGWDTPATGGFKQSSNVTLAVPATPADRYQIIVEFVEMTDRATCRLQWRTPGSTTFVNIPNSNVFQNNTGAGNGFVANFFNDTAFTSLAGTATNVNVTDGNNGFWGEGTPSAALIHRDTFSVRWTGQVQPEFSEQYTFIVNCDDAVKLWVNGRELTLLRTDTNAPVDWPSAPGTERYARVSLVAGVRYDIRLEYLEDGSSARCQLSWFSPSQPRQIIPQLRLYPGNAPQQQPQIISPTAAFATVGGPFSYTIDVSNGATISLFGRPSWLTLNGNVLSGTPPTGASGDYQILITTTTAAGTGVSALNLKVADNTTTPIQREYWSNVAGTAVSNIPTSTTPTGADFISSLEATTDAGEDYGARIRGFITAPVTGNYYFWLAASDAAELWISNDDEPVNAVRRAAVTGGSTTPRNWAAGQRSPWLALEAGKKYYIEVLHKAGTGVGDNLAVGWLKPDESGSEPSEVVPGYVLSTYVAPNSAANPGTLYVATMLSQNGAVTTGVGTATMRVVEDAAEPYALVQYSYRSLTGQLTTHHIHADPYLTKPAGEIVFDFDEPETTGGEEFEAVHNMDGSGHGSFRWTFQNQQGNFTKAEMLELIRQGKSYINLHSAMYPAGEIRGNFTLASGSRTFTPPPAPPTWSDDSDDPAAAARFLIQATFGPNIADIQQLNAMKASPGPWSSGYEAWIEDQFTKPASLQLPEVLSRELSDAGGGAQFDESLTFNAWWRDSVDGADQLRQRVAFALSQIHVVSAQGPLDNRADALSHFYDQLAVNAFGNFRQILETTTLTPAMGRYLDMLRNDKPDQSVGRIPNENYAREIKQLFSIGLFRKWPDGTLVLDSKDNPIVTYTQREIVGFSHVFTGWDYGYDGALRNTFSGGANWTRFMREVPGRHYTGPKRVLNNEVLPGLTTAAGQPLDPYATHSTAQMADPAYQALPAAEFTAAHDQLFNHPNVGPFISRQLIQRLVTSHPSRDYIYRVAQKFNDNGSGVRGDMKAVIKAILLDYEARSTGAGSASVKPSYGKQREALMRVTGPARAFRPSGVTGSYSQTGSHTIQINAANRLQAGNSVYLDFPRPGGTFSPGDTTPTSQIYTVLSTPAPTATSFSVNAKGWAGLNSSTGAITGTYSQAANSTVLTINLSSHWLPQGGQAYLDFGSPTGPAIPDGVYTAATSTSTTGGGSTFTITNATNTTARSGVVRMVGFRGSYTVSNSGLPAPNERRITFDTTNWVNSGEINDHHLNVGDSVFANFTVGNPQPLDAVFTVESVPDSNTFTVTTSLAGVGGGNDGDNGMWIFPLVSQPVTRSGNVGVLPSTFNMGNITGDIDQTPLNAPTVFNFFMPDFKFPGPLASLGITTPEFQDTAETTVVRQSNFLFNGIFNPGNTNGISSFRSGSNALVMDFSPWMGLAADVGFGQGPQPSQPWTHNANLNTLIEHLSLLLTGNQVSSGVRTMIREFLVKPITAISVGNPCTITSANHRLYSSPADVSTPDVVTINGVTGGTFTPSVNGTFTVTRTGANTFTVPVNRSSGGATLNLTNAFCSPVAYDNTSASPSDSQRRDRIRTIVHLLITSPDFTIQR